MFKFISLLFLFIVVGFFCELTTKGFRYSEILTHLPNRHEWEVPPPNEKELREIRARLDQPFEYLGAGKQSVAFLGRDGKTVLKFFKHGERWKEALNKTLLSEALQKKTHEMRLCRPFHPDALFRSCLIAFEDLKEETGLLYLHLNKTEDKWGKVTLYDPIRVEQKIDLDKTEFILQEYSELAFPVIDRQMKEGRVEEAKASLQALIDSIEAYCHKGIRVNNPAIQRNVGFKDGKVVLLDVGSFQKSEDFKTRAAFEKEVVAVSARLERWIRKHHPDLLPYLNDARGVPSKRVKCWL